MPIKEREREKEFPRALIQRDPRMTAIQPPKNVY